MSTKYLAFLALLTLLLLSYGFARSELTAQSQSPSDARDVQIENPFVDSGLVDPFAPGEVKHLKIKIKAANVQKLIAKAKQALQERYIFTEPDDYVPATVAVGKEKARVRLRIKGDFSDHVKGPKWSFRIKVRGNNTLLRMKVFSIQHPKHRNYLDEWIYHRLLDQEDVINLRYEFVKVTINDNYLGLYALEEHFEKRLIEDNRRREGPTLKFDESPLWKGFWKKRKGEIEAVDDTGVFLTTEILPFNRTNIKENAQQYAYLQKAAGLLDSFRKGKLSTSQVFDVEKLARNYAVSQLLGATHGNRWHNVRYYYNPVTAHLEPVGFDAVPGRRFKEKRGAFKGNKFFDFYNKLVFSDVAFFAEYVETLKRIADKAYLTHLLEEIDLEYLRNREVLRKEFSSYEHGQEYIWWNRKFLLSALESFEDFKVYFKGKKGRQLEVYYLNDARAPVQILSLGNDEVEIEPANAQIVFPYQRVKQRRLYAAPFDVSDVGPLGRGLHVSFTIPGSGIVRTKPVLFEELPALPRRSLARSMRRSEMEAASLPYEPDLLRQPPNPEKFPFLTVDDESHSIVFEKGIWPIRNSMVLPKGYRVMVPPGTQLDLYDSATIVSYSPMEFRGTSDAPIVLQAPEHTGGGLAIIRAEGESTFSHVIFRKLQSPNHAGWNPPGAITIYESPVAFSSCQFLTTRSEDWLNVIRSEFSVTASRFEDSRSDALDADFSDGSIHDSAFERCGNDCIDVSGTKLDLKNIAISGAGDKGISAGERSEINMLNTRILSEGIGMASKDLSVIRAKHLRIRSSKIGLSAYQKKPEFGSARMEIADLAFDGVDLRFLIEKDSSVSVDGENMVGSGRKKTDFVLKRIKNGQTIN